MKNDAKMGKELTCQFKIDMRKIDEKFEGKLTCAFKNDMRNFTG